MARCTAFPPPVKKDKANDEKRRKKEKRRRRRRRRSKRSVIQVDLRLKEHKYRQVLSSNVAGCCTTRTDYVVPSSRDGQLCSLSIVSTTVVKELAPEPRKELWHFSSQKADLVADQNAEIASTSILTESCLLDAESQYKQLVWDWAAAPIQIEHPEFDDNFLGAMHLTYLMLAVIICGMEDVLYAINIFGVTNISIPVSICYNNELL
ncbi:hypothetical protein WN943_024100 [Citrus x changshan-huyou]